MRSTIMWIFRTLLISLLSTLALGIGYLDYIAHQYYRPVLINACSLGTQKFLASPDGRTILVTDVVRCNEAAPNSARATIIANGSEFSRTIAPFLIVRNKTDLHARWLDNDHLEMRLPAPEDVYQRHSSAGGVTISYRQ